MDFVFLIKKIQLNFVLLCSTIFLFLNIHLCIVVKQDDYQVQYDSSSDSEKIKAVIIIIIL